MSRKHKRATPTPVWVDAPISPTCEHLKCMMTQKLCGKPTAYAYPAHGGGWCALCHDHGQKHLPQIKHITELILEGRTLRSKSA